MNIKQTHATVRAIVAALADEAKAMVQAIEAKPATTQNRYGSYMTALGSIEQSQGRKAALLVALAMAENGGNRDGLAAAIKALGW